LRATRALTSLRCTRPLGQKLLKRTIIDYTKPRVLITGGLGQIGFELCFLLRSKFGNDNVVLSDIKAPHDHSHAQSVPFCYVDVCDIGSISKAVVENNITWIIHLSAILSAVGEQNIKWAQDINIRGVENIFEVARKNRCRIFAPSSIAAFGQGVDQKVAPNECSMRPSTIYGVSKLYLELLGEYYYTRYGVDFRSIRFPGILSWKSPPGGGTTDYAIDIFHKVYTPNREFTCFLDQDVALPMMYMPDCLRGLVGLLEADNKYLTSRTYNMAAMSFTPAQLAAEINSQLPPSNPLKISYIPDFRNNIALSWPSGMDDSLARKDWGWKHQYDLKAMVTDMLTNIGEMNNKASA